MQRDILIFQNPVIVKGHNIFSLITPKATHVNKARERVKEISEFRQLHDRFKGEVVDGCRAPSSPRSRRAPRPALAAPRSPGCPPPHPQPRGVCATRGPPGQEPLRVLSLQVNGAGRATPRRTVKDYHSRRNPAIGWPDLHRPRGWPRLIPV